MNLSAEGLLQLSRRCLFAVLMLPVTVYAQTDSNYLNALVEQHEAQAEPALISRDIFASKPVIFFPALSPDGEYLVYGEDTGSQINLNLLNTLTQLEAPLFNTVRLRALAWSKDSQNIILELDNAVGFIPANGQSSPSYITPLNRRAGDRYLGVDHSSNEHILVVRKNEEIETLERVSFNGETEELYRTSSRIENALYSLNDTIYIQLLAVDNQDIYQLKGQNLERIVSCGVSNNCAIQAYHQQSLSLWLALDTESDLAGLYSWSLDTGELSLVHSDPLQRTALFNTVYSDSSPVIAQYIEAGRANYGLTEGIQQQLQQLDVHFQGSSYTPYPGANGRWLIIEESDVLREAHYYLYDSANNSLVQILEKDKGSTQLSPEQLSRMYSIDYPAQDGRIIHGFISFPKGKNIAEAPMVILVHGGPWGRIVSTYTDQVQILTNRGYTVFLPNFRASTGYGQEYMHSANQDFGNGVVQQDIIDGVNFLLNKGIGDEKNLAIVGGSFGGFAVLSGLAFTPDLFKVGVAMVPPASLGNAFQRLSKLPSFGSDDPSAKSLMTELLGDLDNPELLDALYKKSPQASLSTISAPLLVMAGADDDAIDINHVKEYSLELLNQGNEYTLLIDEDEGHVFSSELSTAAFLYLTEEFLAQYLGGRKEGLNDVKLEAYLRDKIQLNSNPDFMAGY